MIDEDDEWLRYDVWLLIKHPNLDPALITKTLRLKPHLTHLVGSPRKTPVGTPLPGVHRVSAWSYSYRIERNRFFFNEVEKLLRKLEPHARFLRKIVEEKGS